MNDIVTDPSFIDFNKDIILVSLEFEEQSDGFVSCLTLDGDDKTLDDTIATEDISLGQIFAPVETVDDLPVYPSAQFGDIYFVKSKNRFYRFNTSWYDYADSFYTLFTKVVYKGKGKEITTAFSSLYTKYVIGNAHECSCTNKQANWKDITPRVIFAFLDPDSAWDLVKSDYKTSTLCLQYFDGVGDAIDFPRKFIKNFILWRFSAKTVKIKKQMNFLEIKEFDFSRKYMINGNKFLIKDIQVTFKMDSIQPAQITALTCY
jgi:hypothetical protein